MSYCPAYAKHEAERVFINDVCLRDGLQIESCFVPTQAKIGLSNALSLSGLAKIELTSFTSPKAIPALADAEDVALGITRNPDVTYIGLIPNLRGFQRAAKVRMEEMNFVLSASQSHNMANLRMRTEDSIAQLKNICLTDTGTAAITLSISTAWGCPFEGVISAQRVIDIAHACKDLGLSGITLCDTTGVANPKAVYQLFNNVIDEFPEIPFTAHFHNTRGMALANALAAYEAGVRRFDASLGGLGGCPFAPGASGNACTEDLVHQFENIGIHTGVDLDALLRISHTLPAIVGHDTPSYVRKAGRSNTRFSLPELG